MIKLDFIHIVKIVVDYLLEFFYVYYLSLVPSLFIVIFENPNESFYDLIELI